MSDDQRRNESNDEVRGAIAAFEQILQAIPNDRAALDALYHACEEAGDQEKAAEYLFRLTETLISEGDVARAREMLSQSTAYARDPRATALHATIERSSAASPAAESPPPSVAPVARPETQSRASHATASSPEMPDTAFNMAGELAFAWNLLEAGDLSQEEYSAVVQDLTEMSVAEGVETVSVLHVLEARAHRALDRIMARVSNACGTPVVSLSCFDLTSAQEAVLPMDFTLRRGALIFELVGDQALVAILNPYDEKLRQETETLSGRPCHFFLTLPSEFDGALTRLSDVQAGKVKAGE